MLMAKVLCILWSMIQHVSAEVIKYTLCVGCIVKVNFPDLLKAINALF